MGIYAERDFEYMDDGTVLETWRMPGLLRYRTLVPRAWQEDRTNCFCCSCPEHGRDPFCRNHGFAGARPCEVHKMPGCADEDGQMPKSVQAALNG